MPNPINPKIADQRQTSKATPKGKHTNCELTTHKPQHQNKKRKKIIIGTKIIYDRQKPKQRSIACIHTLLNPNTPPAGRDFPPFFFNQLVRQESEIPPKRHRTATRDLHVVTLASGFSSCSFFSFLTEFDSFLGRRWKNQPVK